MLEEEPFVYGGVIAAVRGRGNLSVEYVRRIETQINMSESEKTAHHQASTGQEHDREGHFRDHQCSAEFPVAEAAARAFSTAGHA